MIKTFKNISLLLMLLVASIITAQTTAIPDEHFEQALIDLGIDSDGVVNGQVLTADVENIVELDFSNLYSIMSYEERITDFTGIENFESLEILNLSNLSVELDEDKADVFNSNFNLREFRADDFSFDTEPFIEIQYLDFSNLDNLEYISLVTSGIIYSINLDNPNSNYENLTIDLSHEYWDPPSNTYTVCINVSDAQAALLNQFPYNTWNIITPVPDANGYVWRDYSFSSTCTLSTSDFDLKNSISIYPNPIKDKLWIDNPNQIHLKSVKVYDMQGKLVGSYKDVKDNLFLTELKSGVYFVKINDSAGFKILKE